MDILHILLEMLGSKFINKLKKQQQQKHRMKIKKKPRLKHSFNTEKCSSHVLPISRSKTASPSSFTSMIIYLQLLVYPDVGVH